MSNDNNEWRHLFTVDSGCQRPDRAVMAGRAACVRDRTSVSVCCRFGTRYYMLNLFQDPSTHTLAMHLAHTFDQRRIVADLQAAT